MEKQEGDDEMTKPEQNVMKDIVSEQNSSEGYDLSAENANSNNFTPTGSHSSTDTDEKNGTMKEREKKLLLKAPTEPKMKTLKIKLNTTVTLQDIKDLTNEQLESARNILANFELVENAKNKREEAMNALEALVYDLAVKIEDGEEFSEYLTSKEKEQIAEELKRLRVWLEDEVSINTPADEFISNKAILDKLTASGHRRKNERLLLPKAIESLNNIFNHSLAFYDIALNMSTSEDPVFTTIELEVFSKLITSISEWWKEKNESYVKQQKYEDPVVTTEEIAAKIMELDRDLKYLMNKMRIFKPKKKVEPKKSSGIEELSTMADNSTVEFDNETDGQKLANVTKFEGETDEKRRDHDPSEL